MKRKKNPYASGPDPDFPFLTELEGFNFPDPLEMEDDIVAIGGNLSPGMLLSAYTQGIFPWYNPEDPIIWQSPDPRFIITRENLHVSASMKKVLKRRDFEIALDRDFPGVIEGCAEIFRPTQKGTWITCDMIAAYIRLHNLGWAHSAESYFQGELVGGCYGIRLGPVFMGESMFAYRSNASKAAFLTLASLLFEDGVAIIDCQVHTDHLQSLGGMEISKVDYINLLRELMEIREDPEKNDTIDRRGNWGIRYGLP